MVFAPSLFIYILQYYCGPPDWLSSSFVHTLIVCFWYSDQKYIMIFRGRYDKQKKSYVKKKLELVWFLQVHYFGHAISNKRGDKVFWYLGASCHFSPLSSILTYTVWVFKLILLIFLADFVLEKTWSKDSRLLMYSESLSNK